MTKFAFTLYCMNTQAERIIRSAYAAAGAAFTLGESEAVTGKRAGCPGVSAGTMIRGTVIAATLTEARAAFVAVNCPALLNPIVCYLTKYSSPVPAPDTQPVAVSA